MKFKIQNKKENRPATPEELNDIINTDDIQVFMSWDATPKKEHEGLVLLNIFSGADSKFERIDPYEELLNELLKAQKEVIATNGVRFNGVHIKIITVCI